jgi:hypothetical protein
VAGGAAEAIVVSAWLDAADEFARPRAELVDLSDLDGYLARLSAEELRALASELDDGGLARVRANLGRQS